MYTYVGVVGVAIKNVLGVFCTVVVAVVVSFWGVCSSGCWGDRHLVFLKVLVDSGVRLRP